jgi:REP element-mobilizing transposase RayT
MPPQAKVTSLYQNQYRIASARLKGWDYSKAGGYFVTICTANRRCHFGQIADGQMRLSPIGDILAAEWQRTAELRPNVILDAWVVMPNHIHGIIFIQDGGAPPTTDPATEKPLKPGSVGAIIGQVKSVCKKRIRANGDRSFDWQPRFHDHIIRDDADLARIREYIINNPAQWELDELYSER